MEGTWNVYFKDKAGGNCRIVREGLYNCVSCRCGRVAEGICRLILECEDQRLDLGVLVPMEGGFGIDKKLPAKHLPQGQPVFSIEVPGQNTETRFIPVRDGEGFAYLSRLADARFVKRGGEVGVILK